jgi:type II secretory pathway component PulF
MTIFRHFQLRKRSNAFSESVDIKFARIGSTPTRIRRKRFARPPKSRIPPRIGNGKLSFLAKGFRQLVAILQYNRLLEALENLATMLQSGLTHKTAWNNLVSRSTARGKSGSRVDALLYKIHDAISEGRSLAEAMSASGPDYFDSVDIAVIHAGEDAGELPMALERLIARRRLSGKLVSTLAAAMAYPMLLFVFGCGVIVFLGNSVIPDINAMLLAGGGTVPLITRALQSFASFLTFGLLPTLIVLLVIILFVLYRWPKARRRAMDILRRVPIAGSMWLSWQLAQFCLILRTLLNSAVRLPEALTLAADASSGSVADSARQLRDHIIEGYELDAFEGKADTGFPPWLMQALAVGQSTGDLGTVLERVGLRSEAAAMRGAAKLGAVVEPLMILIVGTFVGLVAYGALLPIVRLNGLW